MKSIVLPKGIRVTDFRVPPSRSYPVTLKARGNHRQREKIRERYRGLEYVQGRGNSAGSQLKVFDHCWVGQKTLQALCRAVE